MDEEEDEEGPLGAVRYPVMPSLVALQQMRNRLHLAHLGKKLMKWTALATGKELRRVSMEIGSLMKDYGMKLKNAFILLARARYFFPDMSATVLETCPKNACVSVNTTGRSVAGVKVKNLQLVELGCDSYQYLGMSKGGMAIKECKEAWLELLKLMVLLCEFRIIFELVDAANKNATKKQNVLARCIIPRISITMRYIVSELDEQEREESFRLKRFKQLKYKNVKKNVSSEAEDVEEPKIPTPELKPLLKYKRKLKPIPEPKVEPKLEPKVEPKLEPKVESKPEPKPAPKPEPISEPIIIPEPPKLDPLELLMTHINEVVRLAELLETKPIPQKHNGLTMCDLGRLKVQLKKLIEVSESPNKDRVCTKCEKIGRNVSSCSCQTKLETPKPVQTGDFKTPKPDGFEAAMNLMPRSKVKTSIPEYILKPQPVVDATDASKTLDLQAMSTNRIEQLEMHVDQVICMTNHYQCEGLLSKSAEDFIKCCKSVKVKIQEFQYHKIIKAKLDRLKEQVTNLEKITSTVQKEDLSATTVNSFMSCCKEFRAKLDSLKSCRGAPSVCSIEKLLNKIDYSIVLSKEAKQKGLVSESVEEFIKSCIEIKTKIEPHNEPKPQVIDELLKNLNDIIDFITKHKDGALISDSIKTFYKNCKTTKAKLDRYKALPAPVCGKSTCPKTPPKTPPFQSSESILCPCIKTSSHAHSGNSCSVGASVPSEQGTTTTCGQNAEKQKSQHSCKSESTQDSAPPCTDDTCIHKKPSTSSYKSNHSAHPEKLKSVESGSNLRTVRSRSNASVKIIIVPREGKEKMGPKASKKVSVTKTLRIYKDPDGGIVEEMTTVTVKQRVYNSIQKKPSKTNSCGSGKSTKTVDSTTSCRSCRSERSTKRVNLCKVPVTKGFIHTVRKIKSETLIRSLDLSSSYPPFLWTSVSGDTLISLERSHENEIVEQDPFFCASPTTSDDDSVLPM